MFIEIDFNSDEALYMQLRNQIILGIATAAFCEGDALPSVRKLSEDIGINMHTVNKAYTILKQEGYVKVDRRRGAVVSVDLNHLNDLRQMRQEMELLVAKASCKRISREELHEMIDGIYDEYAGNR